MVRNQNLKIMYKVLIVGNPKPEVLSALIASLKRKGAIQNKQEIKVLSPGLNPTAIAEKWKDCNDDVPVVLYRLKGHTLPAYGAALTKAETDSGKKCKKITYNIDGLNSGQNGMNGFLNANSPDGVTSFIVSLEPATVSG